MASPSLRPESPGRLALTFIHPIRILHSLRPSRYRCGADRYIPHATRRQARAHSSRAQKVSTARCSPVLPPPDNVFNLCNLSSDFQVAGPSLSASCLSCRSLLSSVTRSSTCCAGSCGDCGSASASSARGHSWARSGTSTASSTYVLPEESIMRRLRSHMLVWHDASAREASWCVAFLSIVET